MENKKYIFMDVDGTLKDHYHMPESARYAIEKAHENGHRLFLCTGRGIALYDDDLKDLPVDGVIFCAGGQIIVEGKTIFTQKMDTDILKHVVKLMEERNIGFALEGHKGNFLDPIAYGQFAKFHHAVKGEEISDEIMKSQHLYKYSDIKEGDYEYLCKMTIIVEDEMVAEDFLSHIKSPLDFYFENGVFRKYMCEIFPENMTKATGIQHVLDYYHADLKDSIAIGDSGNDSYAIKYAHIGIAMGNATEKIKSIADYVTSDMDDDGLYNAFKHFGVI